MKIYLVGGAIRDELLNLPIGEKDYVVVGGSEKEMLEKKFIKVGKDFPVFIEPNTKEEYALARTEKKVSTGYYGFVCDASSDVTLEEDLKRRDLTINAMAKDENGNIIDPYNGRDDLKNKVLKHISEAFVEDPIRILRVARFKAKLHHLGFNIAPQTLNLMKEMVKQGELNEVTKERVWLEFSKALSYKSPQEFFIALRQCGALKIIFPALDNLWGIPQNKERHNGMCAGDHTMESLKESVNLTNEIDVRFAVLCHDLGKALTDYDKIHFVHTNHDELGVKPIKDWCNENTVPKNFRDLAICVTRFHVKLFNIFNKPEIILEILEGIDAFRKPERIKKFVIACLADLKGISVNKGNSEYALEYKQGTMLEKAYDEIKKIDTSNLQAQNLQGEDFARELKKLRLRAISNLLQA